MIDASQTSYSPADPSDGTANAGAVDLELDELRTRANDSEDAHPASSTDNAIARYDGVAGNLQDSGPKITDAGNIDMDGGQIFDHTTWIEVVKSADQTKNSDTTLADDDELVVAVAANSTYFFECTFGFVTGATPDFQYDIDTPNAGDAVAVSGIGGRDGTAVSVGMAWHSARRQSQAIAILGGFDYCYILRGTVAIGVSSGNISLRWAQNTSDAADTTVFKGSHMRIFQII